MAAPCRVEDATSQRKRLHLAALRRSRVRAIGRPPSGIERSGFGHSCISRLLDLSARRAMIVASRHTNDLYRPPRLSRIAEGSEHRFKETTMARKTVFVSDLSGK